MIASMLVFKKMPANSLPKPVEKKYQPETRINSEKFELLDSKFWEYPVIDSVRIWTAKIVVEKVKDIKALTA